ncbi:MAG: hypothetical protein CSB47_00735 [Proteobacteria bacterium]|nr:MAG: hypothetical protein CSB47_00735 [Pseudomonadota bacterium]
MLEQSSSKIQFLLPQGSANRSAEHQSLGKVLPKVLGGSTRSADDKRDPFINDRVIDVESVFDISGMARDGQAAARQEAVDGHRLLTLEAIDGSTLIIRADRLKEELARLYPDRAVEGSAEDGERINLSVLQDDEAVARGLGNWIWSTLSVLNIKPDGLVETAKDKALELLKDKLGEEYETLAYAGASWAGAKALMWAIESRLDGEPGLYHWTAQHPHILPHHKVDVETPELVKAAEDGQPILVFIHGAASSTVGSFGKLRDGTDEGNWDNLTRRFAGHVYGFEHRTFSENPIENAILLAKSLPKHSKLSLVAHSRGGLVGDLLCIKEFTDDMINRFQRKPVSDESGDAESEENQKLNEAVSREERNQLRQLRDILQEKNFRIERYMRVACPASGTTLLAGNLDLFLSSMLSLINFTVGLIPAVGALGGAALSAFRRIVLEIAEKRIDPHLIPGIEAMLPSSPMTVLLAQAQRVEGIDMAVISGDAGGENGGVLKRIAVMLTDWIIFDHFDNDLIVDTQSMRAGLARRNKTREYFAKGHEVNHFSYFERPDTRRALCKWMTDEQPQALAAFSPIPTDFELKLDELVEDTPSDMRSATVLPDDAPLVFYLPGVMGSHLEIAKDSQGRGDGDRVWFDPFDLTAGGIGQIVIEKENVRPEGIFQRYYGGLEHYLSRDHEVISFPYDWRQSILQTAEQLADAVRNKLEDIEDKPQRQVCFLAHCMGGLVVRAMIAKYPELWEKVVTEHDGHFVMLGTPNNGSHAVVESLIGKGDSVRKLASLDFHHNLQEIIGIIGSFEGVLQLLPRHGFVDTGLGADSLGDQQIPVEKYDEIPTWKSLKASNADRWFHYRPDSLGLVPSASQLASVTALWKLLADQHKEGGFPYAKQVAYVFGLDGHTPCGITQGNGRLYLHGTVHGDGAVSWDSGRLRSLEDSCYWYMPVPHSNLTNSPEYFAAVVDLIRKGKTTQLSNQPPRTRSSSVNSYRYDAGPVLQPGAEDIALSFFGGRPHRKPTPDNTQVLKVSVKASDLRFVQRPLLCGHYVADSIAGAEHHIDQSLVGGALRQRERLGIYPGEIGTSTIVLNPRTTEDIQRGSGRGAIIVGLGEWSTITTDNLTNTVRDGVLQYLLHTTECRSGPESLDNPHADAGVTDLSICSLLMGYNSTTHITVSASIEAIVRGVCEANQQYRYNRTEQQSKRAIGHLEFIELYRDTAIAAAYAVRDLPHRLEKDLKQLETRIIPEAELLVFKGVRERLSGRTHGSGYWSRLMVTDADQGNAECPASCYESKYLSPIPQQVMATLKKQLVQDNAEDEGSDAHTTQPEVVAERLKYVYLSERARAEAINQQRQPGLIEALIKDAIKDRRYNKDISRTLFQLMVPLDFKATMRRTEKLLLVLDGYTANLPWEMLQAGDEPLVQKVAMVRQLVSTRFRKNVTASTDQNACVIGNPSTVGFHKHFVVKGAHTSGGEDALPPLLGAVKESKKVAKTLTKYGYDVEKLYPEHESGEPQHKALDVFNVLFKKLYRILMIAAHGEVNVRSKNDGKLRTGVVLSDGVMLTAAEIAQMEVVPDLVFLNCCHLAKVDSTPNTGYNRLAYSLARELIEMGVRCVIAAGWAVDDGAACTFSETFFEQFVGEGKAFGDAVFEARQRTYKQHPGLNTWGAYQAYGDPNYVLKATDDTSYDESNWVPVAPEELTSQLDVIGVNIEHKNRNGKPYRFAELSEEIESRLAKVPQEWVDRPSIQYQLAGLYGSILPEGFQKAREAFQRAIYENDLEKRVPIEAVQNLGNLEAKQAETLSAEADKLSAEIKREQNADQKRRLKALREQYQSDAKQLIEQSIKRLEGLLDVTQDVQDLASLHQGASRNRRINTERYALLGSAYKRKAVIWLRLGRQWTTIRKCLMESDQAYQKAEGVPFDDNFDPYAMINHLQLSGLLGETVSNHQQLIEKAQEAARRLFNKQHDFFAAAMVADAEIALFLLEPMAKGTRQYEISEELIRLYTEAVQDVPRNHRQFNATETQLQYLVAFLERKANSEKTGQREARDKARVLAAVAVGLSKL